MRQHRKSAIWIIVALLLFLFALYVWHHVRSRLEAHAIAEVSNKPTIVETTEVKSQVWNPEIDAIGTLVAQGVDITTQVAGVVQSIDFDSGDYVDQDAVLIEINPDVLASVAEQSKAKYKLAAANYQRDLILYKQNVIAKQLLENDEAVMEVAKGQQDEDAANLEQTTITAPFAGKLGISHVQLGQFLRPGDVIVNLQAVDPISVDFSLPEVYLHKVQVGEKILLTTSAYPGQTFEGQIMALNSMFDSDTRTLLVRAELPNKNKLLLPGMYGDVKIVVPDKNNVLTVPQMAIQYSPFGDTVYVVQNHKAVQRYVDLGEQRNGEIAITRGLAAGEIIVSVGGNKLQNGSAVITKDELAAQQQAQAEQNANDSDPPTSNANSSSSNIGKN